LDKKVSGLEDRFDKRFTNLEDRFISLESRVRNIEISQESVNAGIAAGMETRKRVVDYRSLSYSSPAGFNARGRIKGRGY